MKTYARLIIKVITSAKVAVSHTPFIENTVGKMNKPISINIIPLLKEEKIDIFAFSMDWK